MPIERYLIRDENGYGKRLVYEGDKYLNEMESPTGKAGRFDVIRIESLEVNTT